LRLLKILGPALIAAIAAMAFVGASSASAAHTIGFCLANEALCSKANGIEGKVTVLAHSPKAVLKNNGFFSTPEECLSTTTVEAESMKSPMPGSVTALAFTSCSGPCSKAESKGLPWTGEVTMESLEGGDYKQTTKEGKALLSGCTFGAQCEYGVPAGGSVSLLGEGMTVKAVNVKLQYKGGSGEFVCGSEGTWNAEYLITACHAAGTTHEPCYLSLLE